MGLMDLIYEMDLMDLMDVLDSMDLIDFFCFKMMMILKKTFFQKCHILRIEAS
jgi:hypothetical protein